MNMKSTASRYQRPAPLQSCGAFPQRLLCSVKMAAQDSHIKLMPAYFPNFLPEGECFPPAYTPPFHIACISDYWGRQGCLTLPSGSKWLSVSLFSCNTSRISFLHASEKWYLNRFKLKQGENKLCKSFSSRTLITSCSVSSSANHQQ